MTGDYIINYVDIMQAFIKKLTEQQKNLALHNMRNVMRCLQCFEGGQELQQPGYELPGPSADLLGQRLIRHGLDGRYGKRFDTLIGQLLYMHHQFAAVQGAYIVMTESRMYLLLSESGQHF